MPLKNEWQAIMMFSIFRSEDMEMYQVTMPNDDAWYLMNEMGTLGSLHFMDLNKGEQPFHLPYHS